MDNHPAAGTVVPLADVLAGAAEPAAAFDVGMATIRPRRVEALSFTGDGVEYFRIWIVNLLLTVATLGVYSAWAKVRRERYFYGHTRLAGAGFDYHGDPIAILKGRVVALGLFGLYSALGYVNLWLAIAIVAILAVLLPWLISRSLRFRLANSSYRSIRFRFLDTTRDAYRVFLWLPVVSVLSVFTLAPFWHQRLKQYQVGCSAYGRSRFTCRAAVGDFYVAYVAAGAACILSLVVFFFLVMFGMAVLDLSGAPGVPASTGGTALVLLWWAVMFTAAQAIVIGRTRNAVWSHTTLGRHRFTSVVDPGALFRVLITNLFGTIITLGLFRPFAQVRLAKYLAGTLMLMPADDFGGDLLAAEADETAAGGEETAELFNLDISF